MRWVRLSGVRLALALLVGAVVLAVLAIFTSAALDRPSKTVVNEVTVDASAATVWESSPTSTATATGTPS